MAIPDLIYCAGRNERFEKTAKEAGWKLGAQLPTTVHYPIYFAEVLDWAKEAAQYVENVIIIPKVIGGISSLPRHIGGKEIRLGYSVPTKFAGTQVPLWEFAGRPVHLLGGSPHKQMELVHYTDVRSVDGNMMNKMAHRGMFWSQKKGPVYNNRWVVMSEVGDDDWGKDANLEAFRRSCVNVMKAWNVLYNCY